MRLSVQGVEGLRRPPTLRFRAVLCMRHAFWMVRAAQCRRMRSMRPAISASSLRKYTVFLRLGTSEGRRRDEETEDHRGR